MKIEDLKAPNERIAYRHNPKHFRSDSFKVEYEEGRKIVVGRVKRRCRKNFRVVGIIKRQRKKGKK